MGDIPANTSIDDYLIKMVKVFLISCWQISERKCPVEDNFTFVSYRARKVGDYAKVPQHCLDKILDFPAQTLSVVIAMEREIKSYICNHSSFNISFKTVD